MEGELDRSGQNHRIIAAETDIATKLTASTDTWHNVGDPGEPAFQNSWVNYGGGWQAASFYKDSDGFVHIRGSIKNGTGVSTNVFTLPVGYRPAAQLTNVTISNSAIAQLEIKTDGSVYTQSGSVTWYSINIPPFKAA